MSAEAEQPRKSAFKTPDWAWFAAFAALVVLTRLWFLNLETIDWDESTYLLRGANLWDEAAGHLDVWNFRPPAFTGILWLLTTVFGHSLLAVRAFGSTCIWIAACFTFLSCRPTLGAQPAGLAVCVLIAALSAVLLQPTMTEDFVIAFLTATLWLLLIRPKALWSAFLAGMCMSLATLTRMNLAYAVLALGGYYLVFLFRRTGPIHRLAVFAYSLGGALPLIALAIAYWLSGAIDRFFLFVFGILLSYAFDQMPLSAVLHQQAINWVNYVTQDPAIYGSLTVFLIAGALMVLWQLTRKWRGAVGPAPDKSRLTLIMVILGLPVLISILTSGAPYAKYWVQMFPFAAFLVALVLATAPAGWPARFLQVVIVGMVAIPTLQYGAGAVHLASHWSDLTEAHTIRRAADRITANRRPGDRVYAMQTSLILWYLGDRPINPFVSHPPDILKDPIMKPLIAAGLAQEDEFAQLIASRPRYIVKQEGPVEYLHGRSEEALLDEALSRYYELLFTEGAVEVYRLR